MSIVDEQLVSDHAITATAFWFAPMRTERRQMGALQSGSCYLAQASAPTFARPRGRPLTCQDYCNAPDFTHLNGVVIGDGGGWSRKAKQCVDWEPFRWVR